ncbi:MAG: hypothetical protein COB09_08230 [Thalassobium sp.]|nr:MAG: hypothetical protein COB09_08230 [Thalassobium sp.]
MTDCRAGECIKCCGWGWVEPSIADGYEQYQTDCARAVYQNHRYEIPCKLCHGSGKAVKPVVETSAFAEWPDEQRIDLIGQNGNDGLHYETTGNAGDRMNGGDTSQGHERLNAGSDTMTGGEQ